MYEIGSMWLGVLCAAGGALAADGPKNQAIPDFATTEKTGWVLDHAFGVDDLLLFLSQLNPKPGHREPLWDRSKQNHLLFYSTWQAAEMSHSTPR